MTAEELYKAKLLEIARQLDQWATESKTGGWSTHQVEPMQKKAMEIYSLIGRTIQ